MTNNEYLKGILSKYNANGNYTQNEITAFENLSKMITSWFRSKYGENNSYYLGPSLSLEVQKSGSRAKGTAIKGSSDVDMFISITDRENEDKLQNYYNELHDFLKSKNLTVRKQNVSIGVAYYNCAIDVVPAKKCNSQSYLNGITRYNDHYLWSNKSQKRTLTNIQKHIDLVTNSRLQEIMMLTKIWRKKYDLDFPSIYIELLCIDGLYNKRQYDLEKDFLTFLKYIKDVIVDKKVVDPSNGQNIISDTLTNGEKLKIKVQVQKSLDEKYWNDIIW